MLAYFISIILNGMGYSTANALLLVSQLFRHTSLSLTLQQSAPPYGPAVRCLLTRLCVY